MKVFEHLTQNFVVNILRVLYETFWDFVVIVTKHGYRDCNGEVWDQFEKLYTSYRIFTVNIRLVKISIYLNIQLVVNMINMILRLNICGLLI